MKVRSLILIIIFLLILPLFLSAKFLVYNWFWGIEDINNNDYFILDLKPEIRYSLFRLKLNIPLEVNSNWSLYRNHWDSRKDIITKIDFLAASNEHFNCRIHTLKDLSLGNSELVYDYSNDLLEPLTIRKAFSSSVSYQDFSADFILDDLNYFDVFFFNFFYSKEKLKAGFTYSLDRDIFSNEGSYLKESVSFIDLYCNYRIWQSSKWILQFQNDYIKNIDAYAFEKKSSAASGLQISYGSLFQFSLKGKYYQGQMPGKVYFNKFYLVERSNYSGLILDQSDFGIAGRFTADLFNWINLRIDLEKTGELNPCSTIVLSSGEDFPSKIKMSYSVFNRFIPQWYQMFYESELMTYALLKTSFPLSRNLSLNLDYLKGFALQGYSVRGLHQVLFYSEFNF